MKYLICLGCSMFFLFASCQIKQFSEGVQDDTKRIFDSNKNFIYQLAFAGTVNEKNICPNCAINKYTILLKLEDLSDQPNIGQMQYPPYYMFKNDSLLELTVDYSLYAKINVSDKVKKDTNSYNVKINESVYKLLSSEEKKWLPE